MGAQGLTDSQSPGLVTATESCGLGELAGILPPGFVLCWWWIDLDSSVINTPQLGLDQIPWKIPLLPLPVTLYKKVLCSKAVRFPGSETCILNPVLWETGSSLTGLRVKHRTQLHVCITEGLFPGCKGNRKLLGKGKELFLFSLGRSPKTSTLMVK